jgi:outer membrane biosynthesis protein TonB
MIDRPTPAPASGAPSGTGLVARRAAPASGRRAPWRARFGGAALSALLHLSVLALFVLALPQMSRAKPEAEREIPVEVVPPPEEKKAEEKKAEAEKPKIEPPKTESPKEAEKPPEPAKPDPPKADPPQPAPPAAEAPKPAPPPAPEPPAGETAKPAPAEPPKAAEAPPPAAGPSAPHNSEAANEGRPADPNEVALADEKDVIAYWDLKPIEIGSSPACGRIRVEGQIRLIARSGKTGFVGTMRVLHIPALCKAEAKVYAVGMVLDGTKVTLLGQDFGDTGVIDGDTMYLRDRYGISTWTRREPRREPRRR